MNESSTPETSANTNKPKSNNRLWLLVIVLAIIGIFAWPTLRRAYRNISPEQIAQAHGIWGTSWDEASALSLQTGKPILIDFTADWCPPCKILNEEVFPQPEVLSAITTNYIPLRADISNSSSPGTPLGEKYDITAIPTLLIVDAQGDVINKQVGLPSISGLTSWLKQNINNSAAATSLPKLDPPPLAAQAAAGL